MNYTLICDGAYSSSKDQGGVGIIFLRGEEKILEYSKMFKGVTNNMMELAAMIIGLRLIRIRLTLSLLYPTVCIA